MDGISSQEKDLYESMLRNGRSQSIQAAIEKCMNNKNVLLIILEAGKSKVKVLWDFISGEGSPPGDRQKAIFQCNLTWQRDELVPSSPFL